MSLAYAAVIGPGPGISACVPWTDISPWINKVETQRGASTELDDIQAGTATITLDNDSGFFSIGRASTGNLLPPNVQTCGDTLGTTAGFTSQSGTIIQAYGSNAYAGATSLKATLPANAVNGWFAWTTDYVPVSVGQTVALTGTFRNTTTSGYPPVTIALSCHFVDANRQTLAVNSWSEADVTMNVGDGWHTLSWNATVPAGAVSAQFVCVNRSNMSSTGIFFADALSISMTCPFANQTTNGVPIRLGAVQGGNMLPYQMANTDHWNDQTTGDIESCGLWSTTGYYSSTAGVHQWGSITGYNSSLGGLQFGHFSGVQTNGLTAYLVNDTRSRITYLSPGTYTFQYVLQGITFGAGATVNTIVNVLNWSSAKAAPTVTTTTTTATTLTTGQQTVTTTVTIPSGTTGLTGVEFVLSTAMVALTIAQVVVSQFQLISGTTVPAFTPGDCYMPLFSGWVDTWLVTTKSASGLSEVELDCTDQFRRLGNLSVGIPYQSMIVNDPHTINYWPLCDAASTTLATTGIADISPLIPYPMQVVSQTSYVAANSYGINAGAMPILTQSNIQVLSGGGTGRVHPNYIGVVGGYTAAVGVSSFQWKNANSTGNCGGTTGKSQFPKTSRINANMPAVGTAKQGSFDCWIELDTPTSGGWQCNLLGNDGTSTGNQGFWVAMSTGTVGVNGVVEIGFNTTYTAQVAIPNLFNAGAHHVCLTWSITAAGQITWNFYFDGAIVPGLTQTATYAQPTRANVIGGDWLAGSTTIASPWVGRISDVVLTDSATVNLAARLLMGKGQYGLNEVGRLALLMDVGSGDTFTDCMDLSVMTEPFPSYSSGTGLTDALKAEASQLNGRFFMGRSGGACYNNFNHAPKRLVFQDSLGTSVDDGIQYQIDGDHVINFAMITTSDGSQYWAYSQASIDARGIFPWTLTASYGASATAQSIVNAIVQYHGKPIQRVPSATFTCINPTMAVQALSLDVGSRVTLNELPVSAPAASSNWIVQSVSVTGEIDGNGVTVPVVAVEMSPDLAA